MSLSQTTLLTVFKIPRRHLDEAEFQRSQIMILPRTVDTKRLKNKQEVTQIISISL